MADFEQLRAIRRELESGRMLAPRDDGLAQGDAALVRIAHPNRAATFLLEGAADEIVRDLSRSAPNFHSGFLREARLVREVFAELGDRELS